MSREYIVYLALLVIALLGSYISSIADKTVGERAKITVFSVASDDLQSGNYYSPQLDVTLKRATDGMGLRLRLTKRKEGEETSEELIFLGKEDFNTALASFTPLMAKRNLGKASEIDLKLFGLQEGDTRLVLQTKEMEKTFKIGKKSYGSSDFYLQNDDTVYLVEGRSIDKIARAQHLLFEDRFFVFPFTDGLKIELQADTNTMTAVLEGFLDEVQPKDFTKKKGDENGKWLVFDKEHKQFANWMRRLRGMEVSSYVEELPPARTIVMTMKVKQDKDDLEKLEFYRFQTENKSMSYAVKSNFTGDLYGLLPQPRMEQLTQDLRNIFITDK